MPTRRQNVRQPQRPFKPTLKWLFYVLFFVGLGFVARVGCRVWFQSPANHQVSLPSFENISAYNDKQKKQLKRWLKIQVTSGAFPSLSVTVVRAHGVIFSAAEGRSGAPNGMTDPVKTTYPLGAVSKPISIATLLGFVESGQIDLDEAISNYLADYRISDSITNENRITPRLLASHLSGLPRDGLQPRSRFEGGAKPFYEQLPSLRLLHVPGTKRQYSNLSYGLLELAMMNVSEQSFSSLVKSRIFAPLGMSHAFALSDATKDELKTMARGNHCTERCLPVHKMDWAALGTASNGLAASAHDLSLFIRSMLKRETSDLLNPSSLRLTRQPQVLTDGDNAGRSTRNTIMWRKKEIEGLGWTYRAIGGLYGSSAAIYLSPEHDIGVAVLSNRNLTNSGKGDVSEIAETILSKSISTDSDI